VRQALMALACLAMTQSITVTRWTVGPLEPSTTSSTSGTSATGGGVGAVRFRGVSAVSDSVVWASGTKGTIVRTADGGRTWQTLPVAGAEALDFRDIDAIDARVAYALSIGPGEASRIYKTVDEGRHWEMQFINHDPKAFFDAMAFWNDQGGARGVAISDSVDERFVILLTRDGGRTWARAPLEGLPPALPGEGAFAASGTNVAVYGTDHVWIGTNAASATRVLRSHDGGRTWAVSTTPLPAGPSTGIFSIAFRDATHGIIVGGDYKKEREAIDNVAITDDGGVTWTLVKEHGLSGFRSAVAYIPSLRPSPSAARPATPSLIAVGPSGADYSDDDGRSWHAIEVDGFHTFAFARGGAGTAGWGAGEHGRLARIDGLVPRDEAGQSGK